MLDSRLSHLRTEVRVEAYLLGEWLLQPIDVARGRLLEQAPCPIGLLLEAVINVDHDLHFRADGFPDRVHYLDIAPEAGLRLHPFPATTKFQFDAVDAAASVAKSELDAAEQQLTAAKQAVEIAKAGANSAQARLLRSQSELLQTKAQEQKIPIAEATYKSALATVERAKANLQQAELNLAYTHILAPITGQVTQKSVDLGQYVSAGQLLFTIVPLDQV